MKKLFEEFKKFCSRGNILELAVGVMIGGAFTTIVNSLVNDLLMPLIGLITGGINLSDKFIPLNLDFEHYKTIAQCEADGVGMFKYGAFIQNVLNFFIIAFCVFLLVKFMSKLIKKEEAPKKEERHCPYCKSVVHDEATKCPHCASDISATVKKA